MQESDTEDCALPISDLRVFAGTFNINGAVLDADDAALWLKKVRLLDPLRGSPHAAHSRECPQCSRRSAVSNAAVRGW